MFASKEEENFHTFESFMKRKKQIDDELPMPEHGSVLGDIPRNN